jgi:hypothetical protein
LDTTGSFVSRYTTPAAPATPARAPTWLSASASSSTRRSTRPGRQPTARRMPISFVRSWTVITIVFMMPNRPINSAMAEVIHAITLTACSCVLERMWSLVGETRRLRSSASICRWTSATFSLADCRRMTL